MTVTSNTPVHDQNSMSDYLEKSYNPTHEQRAKRSLSLHHQVENQSRILRENNELSLEDQAFVEKWQSFQIAHIKPESREIVFLMKSKLAFWIESYRNATKDGPSCHDLQVIQGKVCMKKEGQFVPISEIMSEIEYDPFSDKLISKDQPGEVWSYLSPSGLVRFDRFAYQKLQPVEKLSDTEFQSILLQANSFWGDLQPEVDVGVPKKCVLQVVTTNRMKSNHWALENLFKAYPEHATYRLITEDGNVYSFGFQMELEEQQALFSDSAFPFPLTFTKTGKTRIASPDYEESRPYKEKRITSIPLTQKRLEDIISLCEENNRQGLTFNFIRQNCATLGREVLKRAGVTTPERWQLSYGLSTLLPEWKKVPYVGGVLHIVIQSVKKVASFVLGCISAFFPEGVQTMLFWIPRKVATISANLFVCAIGGSLSSKKEADNDESDDLDNTQRFTQFSRLIRNWTDLFRDDLSEVDAHTSLIEWQLKQKSTRLLKQGSGENKKIAFAY